MKKLFAILAALTVAAPASAGNAWRYEGETGRLSEFDIYGNDRLYLVIHHRNARWVGFDKLRVEFSLRTNGGTKEDKRTWMPYVLYDEKGRCDGKKVCRPPLYPVINFDYPLEYRDKSSGRFLVHSFTIDCKNAPYGQFRNNFGYKAQLNMESICKYHR